MPAARPALIALLALTTAFASVAQEDTADRKRGISNNLASALAETMPKYSPPPIEEKSADEADEDDGVDEDLMLKPKNGIVRLPRVVVEGSRPPIFTERQINTDKGLAELATKRYFADASQALNKFNVPFLSMSQEELAMTMWEEDERLRLLSDFTDQADNELLLGNEEEAKELRRMTQEALGRSSYLPEASALNRESSFSMPRKSNP